MQDYFGPNETINKKQSAKSYGIIISIIAVFFFGWYLGAQNSGDASGVDNPKSVSNIGLISDEYDDEVDFQLFWDVWSDIKENYVNQPVEDVDLFYGAMKGMLRAVGDPYTDYFDPASANAFNEELSGSFSGIGVEIGRRNGGIVVIAPLEGSPGDLAGLRAGDIILQVDGEDVFDLSMDAVVNRIRGEEGTTVTLTIFRESEEEPRQVDIIRQTIDHIGLRHEFLDNGILHIRLSSFDEDTENLLNRVVQQVQLRGDVKGIILDLRNDPGGFLDMAIEVSSEWIEEGVIVSEKDLNGLERDHHARGKARLADIPTVVLVNEGSASASEIVAGALQDYGVATIVGMPTFGKGSVQKYEILSDGSAYRLTVALWFTPDGRAIEKDGIIPDIQVDLTEDDFNNDRDPQLDKAIELLQ